MLADEEEDRNAWTQDDDAWNAFGKKTRIRKPQDDEDEQENAYLQGEAAFQRYVECLQWLLCTQARWLVHTKGMPADLETVVRDLWHIRLRTLSWTQNRDNKPPLRPLDTLVLCYFGLVILQLPASLHDLHTWLSFSSLTPPPPPPPPAPTEPPTTTHLLYHLTRAHLPSPLLHRLPPTYLAALTPPPLTPSRLQAGTLALARLYRARLGVAFPPLNFAPLAYRAYVDGLGLPLEALPVVEKLARGAGVGWGFEVGGGGGDDDDGGGGGGGGEGEGEGERRRGRRWKVDARCWLPEAQLAALVVVAMETMCPFGPGGGGGGGGETTTRGVAAFGWREWIRERERAAAAAAAAATRVVGRAGGGGDGEDGVVVDEYLSAAEKMLQGQNADDTLGLPKATALLSGADADEDEDEDEDEEMDGLLRGDQRVFYEAVAQQAVMPVSLLVKSVGLIEKKLEESAKKIREGRKRSGIAR
ncbi:hypothetical protein SLS58_003679 [Diplodia intermedia]|uniref:Uncharacterized protein n=1 Tax=Diplodia intermedia TaxID=856260 RepID=A0ABR3TWJ8_9PEZI